MCCEICGIVFSRNRQASSRHACGKEQSVGCLQIMGVVSLEREAVSRKPEVFRGQPRSEIVALLFSKRANSHHVCRGDDSVGYLKTPLSRKERVKGEAEVSHDQLGIEIIGFSLQPSQQPTRLREGALCRVSAWRDYFRARSGVGVRRGSVKMA